MKIYFEDGELRRPKQLAFVPDMWIDAASGPEANINALDEIAESGVVRVIYTNSIFAFSNRYAWNAELGVPEVYIRAGEHMTFTRIDMLTNRELREGHNLAKMYISGEFKTNRGPAVINLFSGDYYFLSNFYNAYVMYDMDIYCSTEAAYQAAKTLDREERAKIARMSPGDAKSAGQEVDLRPDWEEVKDQVMYEVCRAKFTMNDSLRLRKRLLDTGDALLVEGNTWHDNYWGDCNCPKCRNIPGRNQLGKTLMRIREELK